MIYSFGIWRGSILNIYIYFYRHMTLTVSSIYIYRTPKIFLYIFITTKTTSTTNPWVSGIPPLEDSETSGPSRQPPGAVPRLMASLNICRCLFRAMKKKGTWLFREYCRGWNPTQLSYPVFIGDYSKALWGSLLNDQYFWQLCVFFSGIKLRLGSDCMKSNSVM